MPNLALKGSRAPVSGPSHLGFAHRPLFRPIIRPGAATHPAAVPSDSAEAPVAWDPEGLLGNASGGGHLARRARERAAKASAADAPPVARPPPPGPPIRPLPANGSYNKKNLAAQLADKYLPVNLDYPGLKVLHFDPPVIAVDGFFSAEECAAMAEVAVGTGKMATSKVGAGNANATVDAAASARRTSTSVLVDDALLEAHPEMVPPATLLQARGRALLGFPGDSDAAVGWGRAGHLPAPRQYCFEGLQVTQYQAGQYFMEHEDGFPVATARENGFNRHATLLVYLNEVATGGATRFDYLNLSVAPELGQALLFFPCFADGTPDARTLHTATTAVDRKIVTQQWVARGFSAAAVLNQKEKERDVAAMEALAAGKRKKKDGKKKGGSGGGFGGGFGANA